MKKLALPLAVAALVLACLSLGRPVVAQARYTPAWEYKVFVMDSADYLDKADYKKILREVGPRKVDGAFKEHVLNHLGKDGWELVDTERTAGNLFYFYLERRKS